ERSQSPLEPGKENGETASADLDRAKPRGWPAGIGRAGLGAVALALVCLLVLLGVLVLRRPAPVTWPLSAVTEQTTQTRVAQASPLTGGPTPSPPTATASRPPGTPTSPPGGVLAPGPTATP